MLQDYLQKKHWFFLRSSAHSSKQTLSSSVQTLSLFSDLKDSSGSGKSNPDLIGSISELNQPDHRKSTIISAGLG